MKLSVDDVRHVAHLAALKLSPEEEQAFSGQLEAILNAVGELESLPTQNVAPTFYVQGGQVGPTRPDVVQGELGLDKALKNAPARAGSAFVVPKIIE
jgi:aspartyl-tRNA(Asn)/glutamyl-tRNA(Gln) amidotransferase subunit C